MSHRNARMMSDHNNLFFILKWHSPSGWAISTNQLSVCVCVCDKTISSPVIGRRGWVWLSRCQVFSPLIGQRGVVWLYTSTLNMRVQLKFGLINKCQMGLHALYRNICHLQQYNTAIHLVWTKCVHESQQKHCYSLKFAQIQECWPLVLCALLSVQLYKGDSSLNIYGPIKVPTWDNGSWKKRSQKNSSCLYQILKSWYANDPSI